MKCRVFVRSTLFRSLSYHKVLLLTSLALLIFSALIFSSCLRYPYTLQGRAAEYRSGTRRGKLSWNGDKTVAVSNQTSDLLNSSSSSVNIYDVTVPYENAEFECIRTRTSPSTTVCLFDVWHDVFISRSLQSAGIWEPYVVDEFIEAVKRTGATAGVLDVGSNIGYYTLLAARLGHRVVAVEPMLNSIQRLHRAAQLEGTAQNIRVIHNAVANVRTKATLRPNGDNQGDARVQLSVRDCSGSCPQTINTVLLDDLVAVMPFRQAVMKIDIQGDEHRAFQRAHRLFRAVHFTCIFMEWMVMRDFYVAANHTSEDKHLVNKMIHFLFSYNYQPYKLAYEGSDPLDPKDWGAWPLDIVWHRLPNDDEKSRIGQNHFRNWPPS